MEGEGAERRKGEEGRGQRSARRLRGKDEMEGKEGLWNREKSSPFEDAGGLSSRLRVDGNCLGSYHERESGEEERDSHGRTGGGVSKGVLKREVGG